MVQMLVINAGNDFASYDLFQFLDVDDIPRLHSWFSRHRHFEYIIMTVPIGIGAFVEQLDVSGLR